MRSGDEVKVRKEGKHLQVAGLVKDLRAKAAGAGNPNGFINSLQ
jgi:hypothetical protein